MCIHNENKYIQEQSWDKSPGTRKYWEWKFTGQDVDVPDSERTEIDSNVVCETITLCLVVT